MGHQACLTMPYLLLFLFTIYLRRLRTTLRPPCLRQHTWRSPRILRHDASPQAERARLVSHLSCRRGGQSIWHRRSRCRFRDRSQDGRGNREPGRQRLR